jgi:hypothetical protein
LHWPYNVTGRARESTPNKIADAAANTAADEAADDALTNISARNFSA